MRTEHESVGRRWRVVLTTPRRETADKPLGQCICPPEPSSCVERERRRGEKGDAMDEPITWDDLPRFMAEVRVKARSFLKRQPHLESLQTTELVDSAVRRLLHTMQGKGSEATWENPDHFLGTLYLAMHSTVMDHVEKRLAKKRDVRRTTRLEDLQWSELPQAIETAPEQVLALHEVLALLEQQPGVGGHRQRATPGADPRRNCGDPGGIGAHDQARLDPRAALV